MKRHRNQNILDVRRKSTGVISAKLLRIPSDKEKDALLALLTQERYAIAVAAAQRMTENFPHCDVAWKTLGRALQLLGRSEEALDSLQTAAILSPLDASIQSDLGFIYQKLGKPIEAESCCKRALRIDPHNFEAHSNLGITLLSQGRFAEAETSHRKATQIKPNSAQAVFNLGNTLRNLGKLKEAEASYRRALQIMPQFAEAHSNLGLVLYYLGRLKDAEGSYRLSLQIEPNDPYTLNNMGNLLKDLGRLVEAEECYRQALRIEPGFAEAYCHIGFIQRELFRFDEAEANFRRALQLKPDHFDAHGALLFSMNYNSHAAHLIEDARRYGHMLAEKVATRFTSWRCVEQPQRLRVGMVSGDLRQHPVGQFLESVLANISPVHIELFAYPTHTVEDDITARLKPRFAAWKPLLGLRDEAAARLIHDDAIHVLIDLSGHTAHNRLPMFAWKPAPIQISWLGYLGTTGVTEMDYVLGDSHTILMEDESNFTEAVWRLPETYICFTPPDAEIAVNRLPALSTGHVTFGSFNNLTKMNERVSALWARILQAVPDSKLFLKAKQLESAPARNDVIQRFSRLGIDADRLIMKGFVPRAEYLSPHHEVDIALDPFPYPGITTSVESLWMGVPVLTLAGKHFLSRQGVGLLTNVGLPDWIAADEDDYICRAVTQAGNLTQLADLRRRLRHQVLTSPVFDAPRFASHFEAALREMWRKRHVR